ncbi:hypothetical protein PHMEG_0004440 [Phytophthora megakarya]|uniref:Uncharacterized protein n=1 Tax=Phytophthora megakarya TaxID=4795 RepID=A0A225WTS8_9STRA|nr:hypothetical protein PHMEG_0004440 [Phytophthora megakarya]
MLLHLVVKAVGGHDHPLTPHQWYNYSGNRRIQDPELRHQVATLSKIGSKPKGIRAYLRKKTNKRTTLKDVHNMIQEIRNTFRASRTDVERAIVVFDGFIKESARNTAEFTVDSESNKVR